MQICSMCGTEWSNIFSSCPNCRDNLIKNLKVAYPPGEDQKEYDNVNYPKHYNSHPSGIEVIQITEHMNFCLGNVIKYVLRHEHKNGTEDLKKAAWYLDREIKRLERIKE
jgi:hypothetical protein